MIVNSFHKWATTLSVPELSEWAWSSDQVVKAVKHQVLPILGIMWHPERMSPFLFDDISLLRSFLTGNKMIR
ncbi:gamma-glutamyl-gamma-aminobutyrate hydrolase family protein [bacterium]|nr:gamma-glutamyl-gamma-aminobutyrate hydrolase family protein [bacterium]